MKKIYHYSFFFRGLEILVYIWCYNNIRIAYLPWNSFFTYLVAMIGVDFFTYWWHRMSHGKVKFLDFRIPSSFDITCLLQDKGLS